MLNYYTLSWYKGTTLYIPINIDKAAYNLENINTFNKFMGTLKNVFDDTLFSIKVTPCRVENILYLEQTACESAKIPEGKYLFDVLSKSSCAPTIINKLIEGVIYVRASIGLEYLNLKTK